MEKYLYKIVPLPDWEKSQLGLSVILSKEDGAFIHLATDEQLERIAKKYFSNIPEYVILQLETSNLPGKLVLETNQPGGNQYYHLYEGSIPLNSVIKATRVVP